MVKLVIWDAIASIMTSLWWYVAAWAFLCYHYCDMMLSQNLNTLRSRQNGRHFADIVKLISFYENIYILRPISPKFVPKSLINNNPVLVQVIALAPTRRQAIIWTKVSLVYWLIYATYDSYAWRCIADFIDCRYRL